MEASTRKWYMPWTYNWAKIAETAIDYSGTAFVFLYIINGLATFLILSDATKSTKTVRLMIGAIALGFSVLVWISYVHSGVKHKNSKKKGRK